MSNNLICITGPDGAGKTTQINFLIKKFKEKRIYYEYKWLRFHHFFSLPILGLARALGMSEVKTLKNNKKIGYHYFYKSKIISNIYTILLFLDTLFFTIAMVYIPMKFFNKNIACDRFIYDTLIDLMISTGNYKIYKSKIGKLFLGLIPKNSKFLMLNADEYILRNRGDDILFDDNLFLKIKLYDELSQIFKIPVVNAGLPVDEVNRQLLELLNE